jgi:phosphoribosylformylglycinamidine synthase
MALASDLGITLAATSALHAHALLFGEDQARYLIATPAPEAVIARALEAGVPVAPVGRAGGQAFASGELFSIPLAVLREVNEGWLPAYMSGVPEALEQTRSDGV